MEQHPNLYLNKTIDIITALPAKPELFSRLSILEETREEPLEKIAEGFNEQHSITRRLLLLTNSSFFGGSLPLRSMTEALIYLGLSDISRVATLFFIFDSLKEKKERESLLDIQGIWQHNLACGVAARLLALKTGYASPMHAFFIGFTHGIGKIFLNQYFPKEYAEVLERVQKERLLIGEAENQVFHFTHQDVSPWLLDKWDSLKASRDNLQDQRITEMVSVADILVRAISLGNPGDPFIPELKEDQWELYAFNRLSLTKLYEDIAEEYENTKVFLEVCASVA